MTKHRNPRFYGGGHHLWSKEEIEVLEKFANLGTKRVKAELAMAGVVRSEDAIRNKAAKLGIELVRKKAKPVIPAPTYRETMEPTEAEWFRIAAEEAAHAKVRLADVVGPSRKRCHVEPRWKAWRRIKQENPQVSIAGIGRVSGHDWTTILSAFKRMNYAPPRAVRGLDGN